MELWINLRNLLKVSICGLEKVKEDIISEKLEDEIQSYIQNGENLQYSNYPNKSFYYFNAAINLLPAYHHV